MKRKVNEIWVEEEKISKKQRTNSQSQIDSCFTDRFLEFGSDFEDTDFFRN